MIILILVLSFVVFVWSMTGVVWWASLLELDQAKPIAFVLAGPLMWCACLIILPFVVVEKLLDRAYEKLE